MDDAFSGLANYCKVINDVMIFDCDFNGHIDRVQQFLKRCEELQMTQKRDKFFLIDSTFYWQ